ncbi:MAG: 4-(cytidine 5'-diphospho)-2-C-methyl-D-erythritol kinase [Terriglobales bacterium]
MAISVRSFAKINLGLAIGPRRADGFHALRTVYQTIALHDVVRVDLQRGTGIEIRCKDPRVPADETNTCWRIAERVLRSLKTRGKLVISIEKQLPVQGGIGAASSNAIATMLGLERVLGCALEPEERLRMAAEVGSDLPLFLIGGTVLGCGRGEEVFPLEDLPPINLVVVTPPIGVSTPQAFADWDAQFGLTPPDGSSTMNRFSRSAFAWLTARLPSGVPTASGDRAETPLLDLVRAGIENDFERVVFPKHPELREVKRVLERAGARYASLSGSGSTVYGLFDTADEAQRAAAHIGDSGVPAFATATLTRKRYWQEIFAF